MAAHFGNYVDYSGAKPPASATHVRDPRLHILAATIPEIFANKHILDIGCNAGSVSIQLALDFHAAAVTGVDIDSKLIAQAEKLLALRASRATPPTSCDPPVVDYFPMSAVLTHGYRIESHRKLVHTSSAASAAWPRVTFFSADWVLPSDQDATDSYHVILALSVIKWIHLEHRDAGLTTFFAKCSSSLKPGGYLVIELQTWDSYQKAIRPNHAPHFQETLQELQLRPETSFDSLLANHGLHLCASSDALPRRINVYQKA